MATYTVIPQSAYDKTDSQAIIKYVKSVAASNKRTGHEYLGRLRIFEEFIKSNYSYFGKASFEREIEKDSGYRNSSCVNRILYLHRK